LPEYWGVDNKEEEGSVRDVDYAYSEGRVTFARQREDEGWVEFDVTRAVNEWATKPAKNHGLYVYGSDYWNGAEFYSSDYGEQELRPKLVVKWETKP
jgi:hypothetical protein